METMNVKEFKQAPHENTNGKMLISWCLACCSGASA